MSEEYEQTITTIFSSIDDTRLLVDIAMSEIPIAIIDDQVSMWDGIKFNRDEGMSTRQYVANILIGIGNDVLYDLIVGYIPHHRLKTIAGGLYTNNYKPSFRCRSVIKD